MEGSLLGPCEGDRLGLEVGCIKDISCVRW